MALNERIFRRGKETRKLPVLMFVGASNQLPEDEALNALLDRFLIRIQSDYVDPDLLNQVLLAGWKMNDESAPSVQISSGEIKLLQGQCRQIDLTPVREKYVDLVHNLRNTGIKVSDRRAVKLQNVIAASAVLSTRTAANISDFWVLKYIWDTEEQIEILAGIIDQILDSESHQNPHPQAIGNRVPNAEELIREVKLLSSKWHSPELSFEEKNVIKDKLRYVQNRSLWIKNTEHQQHIHNEIETLWQIIFQTV
jgi:MoxR-like ATPase